MKRALVTYAALLIVGCATFNAAQNAAGQTGPGWISLFDGKTIGSAEQVEHSASHFASPTPWDTWDSGPVAPPKGPSRFHHFGEVMTCDAALCQRRCRCGKSATV